LTKICFVVYVKKTVSDVPMGLFTKINSFYTSYKNIIFPKLCVNIGSPKEYAKFYFGSFLHFKMCLLCVLHNRCIYTYERQNTTSVRFELHVCYSLVLKYERWSMYHALGYGFIKTRVHSSSAAAPNFSWRMRPY
jgi:subtilase family serine protease